MAISAFAELRDNRFRKTALETMSTARQIAKEMGTEAVAVVAGHGVE